MITRECLNNLRNISKIFDLPIPLKDMTLTYLDHISLVNVKMGSAIEGHYWFSKVPSVFVKAENEVICDPDGLTIGNLFIPKVTLGGTSVFSDSVPDMGWGKRDTVDTRIDVRQLKGLLMKDRVLRFVRDEKNTRMDVGNYINPDRFFVDLSCVLSNDTGSEIASSIRVDQLKQYKALLPSKGEVSVRFTTDHPVGFSWSDDMDNTYNILIAPTIGGL